MLVTPDFIASDFIHEYELGPLLKEAEQGGVRTLWVHVRACAYKKTALKDYQAVLDPRTPLANMMEADRDQAWVRICEEIEKAVNPSREPFLEDSLKDAAPQSAPPIVAPPVGQKPELPPKRPSPARQNVLPVIGGILAVMIVASVILFLLNFNKPQVIDPRSNDFTVPRLFAAGKTQQQFLMQNLSALSSAGIVVAIPRIHDDDSRPKTNEIRYYHPEDREVAMRVAQKVKEALGVELPAVTHGNDDRPAPGYFEIWIAQIPDAKSSRFPQ